MSIATTSSTSSQDAVSQRLPLYYVSASEDSSLLLLDLDASPLAYDIGGPLNPASDSTFCTEEGHRSAVTLGSSFSDSRELFLLPESPSFSVRHQAESTSPLSCPESPLFLLSSPLHSSTPKRPLSRVLFTSDLQHDLTASSERSDDRSIPLTSPGSSHHSGDLERITQLLSCTCCTQRCLAHLSVVQIESCRKWFHSRNRTEQNQFLLDTFHISGTNSSPSDAVFNILEGRAVCRKAFTTAFGISTRRYQWLQRNFKEGVMHFQRKPIFRSEASKVSESKAWMERFFNSIGDRMPHVNQIHLPHFMTKGDIYKRMKRDLLEEGLLEKHIISPSYFYTIWRKSFKHVVIPEVLKYHYTYTYHTVHCIIMHNK